MGVWVNCDHSLKMYTVYLQASVSGSSRKRDRSSHTMHYGPAAAGTDPEHTQTEARSATIDTYASTAHDTAAWP